MVDARTSVLLCLLLTACGRAELTAPERDEGAPVPPQVIGETRAIVDGGAPPRTRFDAALSVPPGDASVGAGEDAGVPDDDGGVAD